MNRAALEAVTNVGDALRTIDEASHSLRPWVRMLRYDMNPDSISLHALALALAIAIAIAMA